MKKGFFKVKRIKGIKNGYTAVMENGKNSQKAQKRALVLRDAKNMGLVFIIVSFLGWVIEMLACYPFSGWQDRGFLTLPFCTIYGVATLFYYFAFSTPDKARFFKFKIARGRGFFKTLIRYVYYFLITAFTAALIEYFTALFFDSAFSVRLWYYESYAYNLSGYISLGFALIWGILSTSFMRVGFIPLVRAVSFIPERTLTTILTFFAVALLADYAFNYIFLLVNGYRFTLF